MKLISMTDFVLEQRDKMHIASITREKRLSSHYLDNIYAYAAFLKQPLTLGMFVPTDEEGNVLKNTNCDCLSNFDIEVCGQYFECKKYKQAKERVLFEGFQIIQKSGFKTLVFPNGIGKDFSRFEDRFNDLNIEDLVRNKITLTQSAVKQLGL